MNEQEVITLRKLLALKQQAESLKFKKALTEQQALEDRAAQLMHESYMADDAENPTAGDLRAVNRFRHSLRASAAALQEAARLLDAPIDRLRTKTRVATGREAAMEALSEELNQDARRRKNDRDENIRDQYRLNNT